VASAISLLDISSKMELRKGTHIPMQNGDTECYQCLLSSKKHADSKMWTMGMNGMTMVVIFLSETSDTFKSCGGPGRRTNNAIGERLLTVVSSNQQCKEI
jgi:hypothetical protein